MSAPPTPPNPFRRGARSFRRSPYAARHARRFRPSGAAGGGTRRAAARSFGIAVLLAILAEAALQLPFVREPIRARAEAVLASRIPGATIASCAAADLTGVVRFDGIRIPLSRFELTVDGIEVAPRVGALLRGRMALRHLGARGLRVGIGPAAGRGDPSGRIGARRLWWDSAPGGSLEFSVVPVRAAAADETAPDWILRILGDSRLCVDGPTSGTGGRCVLSDLFLETRIDRSGDATDAFFQAFGDDVRLADPGEPPIALPPLALDGELHDERRPGRTRFDAHLSVGPHGRASIEASKDAKRLAFDLRASTDALAAFADGLPLDLLPLVALKVDGPVAAHATLAGPADDPARWEVELALDLSEIRRRTKAAGGGQPLLKPFPFRPAADPSAPVFWIGPQNPDYLPLSQIPDRVTRAVLLAEDASFWSHAGFDAEGLVHAARTNLQAKAWKRGGSTVTQQLAKNLWLSREKTLRRKLEEAFLTVALEAALPKGRILEIYLNGIEWGPGVYGVRAASKHYFAKEPRELTAKEAAYLASVIPNPRRYYVYFQQGAIGEEWDERVMTLVEKLHDVEAISDEELVDAALTPLAFAGAKPDARTVERFLLPPEEESLLEIEEAPE